MGTNFYFVNKKSKDEAQDFNIKLVEIIERLEKEFEYLEIDRDDYRNVLWKITDLEKLPNKIHIGKRSGGWKPLFQTQYEYKGIAGMKKWYEKNKDEWVIEDEYGEIFTWEQLEEELINWNPKGKSHFEIESPYASYKLIDGYEWTDGEFS